MRLWSDHYERYLKLDSALPFECSSEAGGTKGSVCVEAAKTFLADDLPDQKKRRIRKFVEKER